MQCQSAHRLLQVTQCAVERGRGFEDAGIDRLGRAFQAVAGAILGGPRQDLQPHHGEEGFGRRTRQPIGDALMPTLAGQRAGGGDDVLEELKRAGIVEHEILDAAAQTAGAAAAAAFACR